ncbi:hypothetical protein PR048_005740 [Dryococelus australis]|uniref:Zinc finger PHD-type domain-containing protein n=1 Tax=Dryococelus australis TaxID=614101 RepID=A0ABQ9I913_9NEOP|nr:hypothetical protein PR048_005740 [Dryococelus australis]
MSSATLEDPQGSTSSKASLFGITPIPKIKKRTSNRGRKACNSTVTTSTPYKVKLVEAEKAKVKEAEQQTRNHVQGCKSKSKRDRGCDSAVESSRKANWLLKKCINFEKNVKESSIEDDNSMSSGTSELELVPGVYPSKDENAWCMFCDRKFSEDSEGKLWVMCIMCSLWAHVDCAGAEKDVHICDFCR